MNRIRFSKKEMYKFFIELPSKVYTFVLIICILLPGCVETPVIGGSSNPQKLVDGTYIGSYKGGPNEAVVRVVIKDKKIANIEILKHYALKGKKAEPIIPRRIIENQSTYVDAVTGATNSSRVIMNAVQKAIEQSCSKR